MKKIDLFLAILMCVTWSSDYIVTKKALEIFPPIFFSSLRFFIVGLIIAPKLKRIPPKIFTLFLISVPLVVLVYGAIDIAIKMNTSITATNIIVEFHVITSILAAYFFLKETITKRQIYGIFVAFLGVLIVIVSNTINNPVDFVKNFFRVNDAILYFNKNNIISLIFLFISVFSWPIYAIFSKKLTSQDVKESEIIGWTAIFGSLFGLIISFIFEKNQIQSIQGVNFLELLSFPYAALFGVLIPHLILHYLIKFYDVSNVSIFSLLVPFFTSIGGFIFFEESFNMTLLFGGFLLIYGIYIAQRECNRMNIEKHEISCNISKV